MHTRFRYPSRHHTAAARGRALVIALATAAGSCTREPVAPSTEPLRALGHAVGALAASPISVTTLLDSFAIGGVYAVLPRGGFTGRYARSPEKEQYAGTVSTHPTGIQLPVGLPVRVVASGSYTSRATAAFLSEYCAQHFSDRYCAVSEFTYTVHGLAPGPEVLRPYEPGVGLRLAWSRTAGFYDQFYGIFPTAEFFRGVVPATDTTTRRELYFHRAGCCYYFPSGSAAWETYEGSWRFGVVPDDGARAELGEAPVLRLEGPRTDAPMAAPATFALSTANGDSITATRWWYVRAANNVFDGEPVPMISVVMPWGTIQVPTYPDEQRTAVEELTACAGQTSCSYQSTAAGAVVAQAAVASGLRLAARNVGSSAISIEVTMVGGDSIIPSGTRVSALRPVTRVVEVSVRTATGAPASGREVALRVVSDSLQSGGHSHAQQLGSLPLRPTGRFVVGSDTAVTTSVLTGTNGRARATYIAPVVGGTEVLWAVSVGSDSVPRRLVLAVPGIVAVRNITPNYFMASTRNHSPMHNHARRGVIEAVDSLLGLYRTRHRADTGGKYPFTGDNGGRFRIDAVGLPRGGLYDVNGLWNTVDGHNWHREGLEVDVNDRITGSGAESLAGRRAVLGLCTSPLLAVRPRACLYHLGHFHITYGTTGGGFP